MPVLQCASQTSHNDVEKVTLDVGGDTGVSVYKLNVQILSQTRSTKKGVTTSLQGKTTMSDDFELGENEMDPTASVTFSASLRIT